MSKNQGYELVDSGNFRKLERIGPFLLDRPSPQAVWQQTLPAAQWQKADGLFVRESGGTGHWNIRNKDLKKPFNVVVDDLKFIIDITDFGHLGIFPEQRENWQRFDELIKNHKGEFNILNLFAYTGGSTLACARAGAKLVHVDASKTSVAWAKDNAEASNLGNRYIRWIVEDVRKFVGREVKRKSLYQAVILDPPSFGRGNKNEVWKIEDDLHGLLTQIKMLLAPDFRFLLISAHTPGYTPKALENILRQKLSGHDGRYLSEELMLPCKTPHASLPSGAGCLFVRK